MGRKTKQIRWTLNAAAIEFGCSVKTLAGQIKEYGILCGADGKWSTSQICQANFDSSYEQRTRLVREQADAKARENALGRGEVVAIDEFDFPLTFKEALRLTVGGRDEPTRHRIFREWWRGQLHRMAFMSGSGVIV